MSSSYSMISLASVCESVCFRTWDLLRTLFPSISAPTQEIIYGMGLLGIKVDCVWEWNIFQWSERICRCSLVIDRTTAVEEGCFSFITHWFILSQCVTTAPVIRWTPSSPQKQHVWNPASRQIEFLSTKGELSIEVLPTACRPRRTKAYRTHF